MLGGTRGHLPMLSRIGLQLAFRTTARILNYGGNLQDCGAVVSCDIFLGYVSNLFRRAGFFGAINSHGIQDGKRWLGSCRFKTDKKHEDSGQGKGR
jgi:hypothetical protein